MKGEFFIIKRRIGKYLRETFTSINDKILDIGSGSNPYYHRFMEGRITCFDTKNADKTHVIGDADFLPFKKDSFDKIIAVNSLYYFKNPFKFIENAAKILKKNGKLAIITPFFYPIHDAPIDKYRFTEFGLRELMSNNFKIENIYAIGGIFNFPAIILHSILKGLPLIAPKPIRKITKLVSYGIFYIPYILAQLASILDVLDRTRRFPTYYITVAKKK